MAVYVIAADNGLVKIGISWDPKKRVGTIQGGSPIPVRLVYVCEVTGDAGELERLIHDRMRAMRSHGEWFRISQKHAVNIVSKLCQDRKLNPRKRQRLPAVRDINLDQPALPLALPVTPTKGARK